MKLLQFQVTLATLVSLLATVCGAAKFVNDVYLVTAGQPFELKWTDAQGAVTINLMSALEGGQTDLQKVLEVVSGYTGGDTYTWTPPSDLKSGIYSFEITDDSGTNYSLSWSFQALPSYLTTTGSSSTSATATAATTSTTSPSATSESSSALGKGADLSTSTIVVMAMGASLAILGLLG